MMISDRYMAPESWNHFIRTHLYPDVSLPSYVINSQWSMDYPPVSAFCKKYSVSLQAILTALFERAVRSYHKGAIDAMPLAAYVPVNTRRSPFALPSHKNSVFYPAICVVWSLSRSSRLSLKTSSTVKLSLLLLSSPQRPRLSTAHSLKSPILLLSNQTSLQTSQSRHSPT